MERLRHLAVGPLERASRPVLASFLLFIAYTHLLGTIWFVGFNGVAFYLYITALIAWDPFYALIDFFITRLSDYLILHQK
ncbi:MAG: DUF2892 domain-containing protein [Gammaproteobacteria bacterium]|nr:DUF2892 domain-containing protein [Gammaproteobacteria bacterium]